MVMTFFPHPIHVLNPKFHLPLLVSLRHRLKLIERMGVSICVIVKFTKEFSNLKPREFIHRYLVKAIRPKEVFLGNDFRFGKNRSGDIQLLKKTGRLQGFKIHLISPVKSGNRVISSTLIRRFIVRGSLNEAKKLLGREVSILGKVKKGDGRGERLGFPTANLDIPKGVILPHGVFAVEVVLDNKTLKGMANVGYRPSFNKNKKANVEVHIFDYHKNIYRKEIEVKLITRIRDEKRFKRQDQLIKQVIQDKKKALAALAKE